MEKALKKRSARQNNNQTRIFQSPNQFGPEFNKKLKQKLNCGLTQGVGVFVGVLWFEILETEVDGCTKCS